MKQTGDVPKTRDDHSLSQIDNNSFMIFGGFVDGSRVNECFIGTKEGNTITWKEIAKDTSPKPDIRNSHSSVIIGGKAYISGGQDDDNNKIDDMWELDLASETYKQIDKSSSP